MRIWGIGPCSSGLAGAMGRVTDEDLIREKKVLASIREDQEHISSIRRYGFFVKSWNIQIIQTFSAYVGSSFQQKAR